jgi:hypothetical protein
MKIASMHRYISTLMSMRFLEQSDFSRRPGLAKLANFVLFVVKRMKKLTGWSCFVTCLKQISYIFGQK